MGWALSKPIALVSAQGDRFRSSTHPTQTNSTAIGSSRLGRLRSRPWRPHRRRRSERWWPMLPPPPGRLSPWREAELHHSSQWLQEDVVGLRLPSAYRQVAPETGSLVTAWCGCSFESSQVHHPLVTLRDFPGGAQKARVWGAFRVQSKSLRQSLRARDGQEAAQSLALKNIFLAARLGLGRDSVRFLGRQVRVRVAGGDQHSEGGADRHGNSTSLSRTRYAIRHRPCHGHHENPAHAARTFR